MTLQLTFKSNLKLEFAFGKIAQGKEMQLYGEYFPAIAPLIADYSNQQVGTFSVISSNSQGTAPEMGALTQWSSLQSYLGFYQDPRFTKVKPLRDDSLRIVKVPRLRWGLSPNGRHYRAIWASTRIQDLPK